MTERFNLDGLREAFALGQGIATGETINLYAACTPVELEREGWIEKANPIGRWMTNVYKPGARLEMEKAA